MGKQKLHQPGSVLLSQYACVETRVCPLPCDRTVLFPCPFISWHLRGDRQGGHQSMSMSVVMLLYCALGTYPRRGLAPLTPHSNWITYFQSLLTYLFAHWWPRYGRPCILLRSLGPSTMDELRILCVCTFPQRKFGATEPPTGREKSHSKEERSNEGKHCLCLFLYF